MTEISHHQWLQSIVGKDLSDGEARELFMISRRERYTTGEKLFDAGDEPLSLFLMADGEVHIEMPLDGGGTTTLAHMTKGSVIGEMSLLTKEKRSARAVVKSESATVLRVAWKDFEELLNQNPAVAYKLMYALARVLAARLKNINAKVAEMAVRNLNQAPHEQIEEFQTFKKKLFSDWSF